MLDVHPIELCFSSKGAFWSEVLKQELPSDEGNDPCIG
ncbi:hypothetical protein SAMN06295960_3561 [Paenibacillus aquistagni]|uniref:Uncharacterized protein n=1 Tax=Paenibacillus aquistagni TaxID=1852522 RepID=A0A1X7LJB5_9BACL|nr:hypothetical protein SAMN06295960_3561 [Paenibacillus aquistagni]